MILFDNFKKKNMHFYGKINMMLVAITITYCLLK